jgi:predicted DNA-binding transcriptional regulator YafY
LAVVRKKTTRGKRPAKVARASKQEDAASRDDRGKRLLDLVVLLLGARAPVPYREIRAQFKAYRTDNEEAGLRAFERDKAELLELGVPLRYVTPDDDDSVDEGGYVVDLRRYRLPEIHLTSEEAAALVLAGSVARAAPGTTYDEVVDLAIKKLAFDLPAPPDTPGARLPREPVLVHFPRGPAQTELAERLSLLEQAIRNRKRTTFRYVTASSGAESARDVEPYGLVYRQGAWTLVAHDHLRKDVRSFRLDRMTAVEVAPKPKSADFELPAGFDVRRYGDRSPWTFAIEAPVDVELDIHGPAAGVALEDFGDDARKLPLEDGGTRVHFACTNPAYLVSRVLGAKGALVVRGPEAMRARVREELAAMEKMYS